MNKEQRKFKKAIKSRKKKTRRVKHARAQKVLLRKVLKTTPSISKDLTFDELHGMMDKLKVYFPKYHNVIDKREIMEQDKYIKWRNKFIREKYEEGEGISIGEIATRLAIEGFIVRDYLRKIGDLVTTR